MIVPFDLEFARETIDLNICRVKTKCGHDVYITNWYHKGRPPHYVLAGKIIHWGSTLGEFYWTKEGYLFKDNPDDIENLVLDIDDDMKDYYDYYRL